MKNILRVLPLLLLIGIGCQVKQKNLTIDRKDELPFIPNFHFTPPAGWMNDPNGMVFFEGEYHLFYQYYPDGLTWGPMHWGHAISDDMIHWEHLPIALFPDENGYIFSGSAVIDINNTSGLGTKENPPMVAIYTYHNMSIERQGKSGFQTQGIASSTDKGRTWVKYSGNPVLENSELRDFRDPKVSWNATMQRWIMVLAVKDHVSFYSSENFISWEFESDFGLDLGAHGGVWECPDLFQLTDENGIKKWVLLVSINPGGPNLGSATQYFIGTFDGKFVPDDAITRWVEYGTDNYAGVTWSGIPPSDGRVLAIGWMNNWNYANQIPESGERGATTIPREFFLQGSIVGSRPVNEIYGLRKEHVSLTSFEKKVSLGSSSMEFEIQFNEKGIENYFQMVLSNDNNEKTIIELSRKFLTINRSDAGTNLFSDQYVGIIKSPLSFEVEDLSIFLDRTSVEVFINGGLLVSTQLIFPTFPYNALQLTGDLDNLIGIDLYTLNGIEGKENQ